MTSITKLETPIFTDDSYINPTCKKLQIVFDYICLFDFDF